MDRPLLYKRLGQTISERRRALGLTQERLSKQLGISRASLANVETGRQRVLVDQLYALAETLGVDIAALLPHANEIRELQVLDTLSFSENVSVDVRRQIARLLEDEGQGETAFGGQGGDVPRTGKTREGSA